MRRLGCRRGVEERVQDAAMFQIPPSRMGRKLRGELRIADVSRSRPGRLGPLLAHFQHAPLDSSSPPSVHLEEVGGRVGVKVTSGTMSYSGTSSSTFSSSMGFEGGGGATPGARDTLEASTSRVLPVA